jgi:hypothetical protein
MANRSGRSHDIELEYAFDRLQATKLEQVFAILVPNRERRIDESTGLSMWNKITLSNDGYGEIV